MKIVQTIKFAMHPDTPSGTSAEICNGPSEPYKRMVCPCCKKEVNIPLREYSTGFDFNYSILINSRKKFFDLVDICPECGVAMLFEHPISRRVKKYIKTKEYKNILNNNEIETGLRNWILLAVLYEYDQNFVEAGIAYMKAYDYLELKGLTLDPRLIEKAASCFLSDFDKNISLYKSFFLSDVDKKKSLYQTVMSAFLAADCMRRDGEMEAAKRFLENIAETFSGDFVNNLVRNENLLIDLGEKKKNYLEI